MFNLVMHVLEGAGWSLKTLNLRNFGMEAHQAIKMLKDLELRSSYALERLDLS